MLQVEASSLFDGVVKRLHEVVHEVVQRTVHPVVVHETEQPIDLTSWTICPDEIERLQEVLHDVEQDVLHAEEHPTDRTS